MVELASVRPTEQRRQRAAAHFDVFLNVAGVVRHHDEPDPDDRWDRPDKHDEIEFSREDLVACERNEPAHDEPAYHFSDGKVGDRRFASGIGDNDHRADDSKYKRDPSSAIDDVDADRKGGDKQPNCQAKRRRGVDMVVHEHSVGRVDVILFAVRAFDEVVVVVEGVDRSLHEDADGEQRAHHKDVKGGGVHDRAAYGDEHGQNGCGPCVRCGELDSHLQRESLVRSLVFV